MARTFPKTHYPWPALWMLSACAFAAPVEHPGRLLYQKLCAECHGDRGQGVEDEYDEPLTGEKSLEALARQIDRTMPEDDPDKTTAADSKLIAEFMYDAFYSPNAQVRNNPPRKDLARLAQVSQISAKSSDFRPSAALEALILRGGALADPLWADLGC